MTDDSSRLRAPGETPGASTTGAPIDTERLRALLAASTPGPWAVAPWHQETVLPKRWIEGDNDEAPLEDRGPFGSLYASGPANAALVAEALTALPALLDEVERLQCALTEAAAWLVRDVGIPVDMTTSEPPPPVLREAMYRYCFDDPNGTVHGGDLTYDELVAYVDQEAHWAPLAGRGEAKP